MKQRTAKYVIAVAMLSAVSLYFIGGTYARYASEFNGTASVESANWAVALTATSDTDEDFTINLTPVKDDNVVEGKIAPGITAEGTVEISLEGTEVAVDILAKEGAIADALKGIFGENAVEDHDITVGVKVAMPEGYTVTDNANGSKTVALKDGVAFTSDAVATVTVTVTWENNDDHNATHTAIGEAEAKELSIPVTLSVQQHITTDTHTAD